MDRRASVSPVAAARSIVHGSFPSSGGRLIDSILRSARCDVEGASAARSTCHRRSLRSRMISPERPLSSAGGHYTFLGVWASTEVLQVPESGTER